MGKQISECGTEGVYVTRFAPVSILPGGVTVVAVPPALEAAEAVDSGVGVDEPIGVVTTTIEGVLGVGMITGASQFI